MKKRVLTALLTVVLCMQAFCLSAFAADADSFTLTYQREEQTVTIEGSGLTPDTYLSLRGYVNDEMDYLNQVQVDSDGNVSCVYPSNGYWGGDVIKVILAGQGVDVTKEITVEESEMIFYQEDDANLRYTGSWTYRAASVFFEDCAVQTAQQGASMKFGFNGTALKIYSYRSASQGNFDLYIDGEFVETVQLFDESWDTDFRYEAVSIDRLASGYHTAQIVVNGKHPSSVGYNVYIDAIAVDGTLGYEQSEGQNLVDDEAIVVNSKPMSIDVLSNDTVEEGAALSIASQPASGTAEVVDGKIVFTPNTLLVADDSFTYAVGEETATVTLIYNSAIVFEEDFAGFEYGDGWVPFTYPLYSGGAGKQAKQQTSISFTYEGSDLDIVSYKSKTRGIFTVTIDGEQVAAVDCYENSYDTLSRVVFSASDYDIEAGTHEVVISVAGEKNAAALGTAIDFDAVIVSK